MSELNFHDKQHISRLFIANPKFIEKSYFGQQNGKFTK